MSLKIHPDRVEESEKKICTEKFQILGRIHAILSDEEKRSVYDRTGTNLIIYMPLGHCANTDMFGDLQAMLIVI